MFEDKIYRNFGDYRSGYLCRKFYRLFPSDSRLSNRRLGSRSRRGFRDCRHFRRRLFRFLFFGDRFYVFPGFRISRIHHQNTVQLLKAFVIQAVLVVVHGEIPPASDCVILNRFRTRGAGSGKLKRRSLRGRRGNRIWRG